MTGLESIAPPVLASFSNEPAKRWPIGRLFPGILGFEAFLILSQHGVDMVYAGMIMLALGVCFVFYVRPRLAPFLKGQEP